MGWCEKVRLKNSAYPVLQCKMAFLMTFWAQILQFFSTYVLPNIFFLKDICMNNTDKAKNLQKKIGSKMTPPPPTEPLWKKMKEMRNCKKMTMRNRMKWKKSTKEPVAFQVAAPLRDLFQEQILIVFFTCDEVKRKKTIWKTREHWKYYLLNVWH